MSDDKTTKDKNNESNPKEKIKPLPMKRNKPARPQCLHVKTGYSYNLNLPTYEESQAKYEKFLLRLPDKKVTTNE